MALQIEAPESIRLIEEVSRRTGETSERAVQVAMRDRLNRLPPPRTPEEAVFKEYPEAMVDHAELLSGEDVLPRRSSRHWSC